MGAQIRALQAKLSAMINKAGDLADSTDDDTADKYGQVLEHLETAYDAFTEAESFFI